MTSLVNFQHIVLTRFNLYGAFSFHPEPPTAKWQKERIELFEKFCLPSMIAQKQNNFTWFVMFDAASDKVLRAKVEEWKRACPMFFPMYFERERRWQIAKQTIVNEILEPGVTHLLSTRLDNDDALHENFVRLVQSKIAYRKDEALVIDAPNGYRLDLEKKWVYERYKYCSPFISYLEKLEPGTLPKTVLWFPGGHDKAFNYAPVISIKSRTWLQVIHGDNLTNAIQTKDVKTELKKLPGFPS